MIGCISPIFWGLSVSLVRTLSETLGVGKGLAINYLIALSFRISAIRRSESESYAAEVLHLRLGLRYRHLHDFCVFSWLG